MPLDVNALLAKFKEHITGIGLVISALAAISTTLNSCRIDGMKREIQEIDLRDKNLTVTSKLTETFFTKFLEDPQIKSSEKKTEALLSILDLLAQASANDGGWSETDARRLMPLNMALLFGKSGGVAKLDPHYRYISRWAATALCDDDPGTSVTAIKALRGLCLRALSEGNVEVANECTYWVDKLVAGIGTSSKPDEISPYWLDAIAIRTQLIQGIARENDRLVQIESTEDGPRGIWPKFYRLVTFRNDSQSEPIYAKNLRTYAQNPRQDIEKLIEEKNKLEALRKPQPLQAAPAVDAALASANAAVNAAAQNERQVVVQAAIDARKSTASGTNPPADPVLAANKAIADQAGKIIESFRNLHAPIARPDLLKLSLLGQPAVSPIITELGKLNDNNDGDGFSRLALLTTLKLMQQPITFTDDEAKILTDQLTVEKSRAFQPTVDFLMDLWDEQSIQSVYAKFEIFLKTTPLGGGIAAKPVDIDRARRAALIVGTWSRNLNPSIRAADSTPMRDFCLTKAKGWQGKAAGLGELWSPVNKLLLELISKADQARIRAGRPASTAPPVEVASIAPVATSAPVQQFIAIPVQSAPAVVPAPAPSNIQPTQ